MNQWIRSCYQEARKLQSDVCTTLMRIKNALKTEQNFVCGVPSNERKEEKIMSLTMAPAKEVGAVVAEDRVAKRLNITLTDTAYAEVTALSRSTRRSITELVRLGLAFVKIWIEESSKGNKLVVTTPDGRALKELILPSF